MKKRILFLLLALLMLLSACGGPASPNGTAEANKPNVELTVMGDSNPMPGFDAQNQYTYLATAAFQETADFYMGNSMGEAFLHYYDKTTDISDYLCADPACEHENANCGAFIDQGASAFYYNGQRWWIA